ncbi:uncharacterized protein LOC122018731 [Zingiber officinale]|uniref:uncharacterized protein LOC122018731 n=1 Tax=Zingiber officinale TaxID=94328 RepID=UPI001C4AAFF2|nr:uncharacterized protein LOC122018731 [Zingiber officinale]
MLIAILFGFFAGVVALVAAEGVAFLWLLRRLIRKRPAADVSRTQAKVRDLGEDRPLTYPDEKKGSVWLLDPDKVPKINIDESSTKVPKEKKNKSTLEVVPVRKYGKIKDHLLILSDSDGSRAIIKLLGCTVVAVSASNLSSRKWAKRYPIKVESKDSVVYKGSKTCYLYFDTSWEKESWCRALRLASSADEGKRNWYTKISEDFQDYLSSLNNEYPSFLKPSVVFSETTDKSNKIDGSSRVRLFWKKLAKKTSKNGIEGRMSSVSSLNYGEKKTFEKSHSTADISISSSADRSLGSSSSNNIGQHIPPTSTYLGSKSLRPGNLNTTVDEKIVNDEGTLCCNLLFSRLFFDAKRSININSIIKARIQKNLSNMRRPSYIGEIICTGLDIGNLPPYIHRMRVFPMDLNEVWSMEVDIEYSGGILLDIETRLEVCEPELQKNIIEPSLEPNSAGEVNSDLLDGIEYYGNQLKYSNLATVMDNRNEAEKADSLRNTKSAGWTASYVSRWKTILHSVADQVSQVPLSLAIRVVSLRGTLRLQIKPPPSDQLWFGFTNMPELDWNLDSSIGDRKLSHSHIGLLIGNRIKAAIRDSLVLPNCESICIPWMIAEKDDWVPSKVAPFLWTNNENADNTELESSVPRATEDKLKVDSGFNIKDGSDDRIEKVKYVMHVEQSSQATTPASSSTTIGGQTGSATSFQTSYDAMNADLKAPLLTGEPEKTSIQRNTDSPTVSMSRSLVSRNDHLSAEDDDKPKKISRRARMMDFGKKVGDKLEEKRRHIEEKGRHIVEKMRENARTGSYDSS